MTSHLPIPAGPEGFQQPPLEKNRASEGMPTPASAPDSPDLGQAEPRTGKNIYGTPAAKDMEPKVTRDRGKTGLTAHLAGL